MNISACLVTRGDVGMKKIVDSLPLEWEKVLWINHSENHEGQGEVTIVPPYEKWPERPAYTKDLVLDLSVYGRYAAIEYASHDLIYVQDDDVIVSDPQAIVDEWMASICPECGSGLSRGEHIADYPCSRRGQYVVCNMPQEFRHDFYRDHALVGFGSAFHRDAPKRVFEMFRQFYDLDGLQEAINNTPKEDLEAAGITNTNMYWPDFDRDCDLVFTALTPCVLVDVPKQNLPWAEDDNRLYRQRDHQKKRQRMLELALKVRDA